MIKIKEIRVETLQEALEEQNYLLEENKNYTFKIVEVFMNGYCLEVYQSKYDKLHNLLNGFYNSIKVEVEKMEYINK